MSHSSGHMRAVARVLIKNQRGDLLLCRSRNGKSWVPPGGTVDPGEDLAQAAVREAMEEAGLLVERGPLVYLQEFRPADRSEHVLEVAFLATTRQEQPTEVLSDGRRAVPAGDSEQPWRAWHLQDPDGPRREVRWFSRAQVAALTDPIYPAFLRDRFWQAVARQEDPYLGLVQA